MIASQLPGNKNLKPKMTADIIGHIPKEIFRALSFFINRGDKVTGSGYSPQCSPSPIATRDLEVLVDCNFKI